MPCRVFAGRGGAELTVAFSGTDSYVSSKPPGDIPRNASPLIAPVPQTRHAMPRSNPMAAKKFKCGRKLILEMDKVRGRCYECVKEESRERTRPRKRGGKRGK